MDDKCILIIEPLPTYGTHVFTSLEELHQWKIKNVWNGIDIAVTEEDIRRVEDAIIKTN